MKIAQQILETLLKSYPHKIQSFIVYGSTSQGIANEESDLDIQIIVDFINNPLILLLNRIKPAFEEKYDMEVAINVKSLSQILDDLGRKEPLYYFILTDGICLLDSTVFKGLKHILKKEIGPSKEALKEVHAKGIVIRSKAIKSQLLMHFTNEVEKIFLNYLKIKMLTDEISITQLDPTEVFEEQYLKKYFKDFDSSNFVNLIKFKENGYQLNRQEDFDIINILTQIIFIFHETLDLHNE